MSGDQLSVLLAKLKEDAEFREKLKGAADLDAAVAIAKEAGFDVSQGDWLTLQGNQASALSDDELEINVAGGNEARTHGCTWRGATCDARNPACPKYTKYPGAGRDC